LASIAWGFGKIRRTNPPGAADPKRLCGVALMDNPQNSNILFIFWIYNKMGEAFYGVLVKGPRDKTIRRGARLCIGEWE
jgi:hypothetical protein